MMFIYDISVHIFSGGYSFTKGYCEIFKLTAFHVGFTFLKKSGKREGGAGHLQKMKKVAA